MSIVSATGLTDLSSGRGTVPFIFIISPHMLPYKGQVVSFFPSSLTGVLSWVTSALLSHVHSLGSLSTSTCIACRTILQPPCCLAYLAKQVLFCQYGFSLDVSCVMCNDPACPHYVVYEHSLWSLLLGSTMTPCVHGLQSSHWTATVDSAEKKGNFLSIIFQIIFF